MNILKRPPGDVFTFRQFVALTSQITVPKDSFYLWSTCIDPDYKQISHFIGEQEFYENEILYRTYIMDNVKNDLIILGIKDHLTSRDFNYWTDQVPNMVVWLEQMADYYADKTIILFTSLENLGTYITSSNIKVIPWGGDVTNHQQEYQKLEPVVDKNLDSKYTFLSLSRNKRAHRAMLVSLLHGLEIQNRGLISCMFKDSIDDLFKYTKWKVSNKDLYLKGFETLKNTSLSINDDPKIYHNNDNDNTSNFKNKLANYYKDTFVEIVCETSYTEACYNLTEKTLNSIYGCSFPILLCSKGSVEFLRSIGLDMFDDIIDHSYDIISDPAERLECAILKNKELLTNNKHTKDLWIKNQNRFKNNIDFCRKRLYNFYNTRSNDLFKEILHDYNLQK